MDIKDRIALVMRTLTELNNLPTERPKGSLVTNIMMSSKTEGKHIAKMVIDAQTFTDTFTPSNPSIEIVDAHLFGYEVRFSHNDVIVECLMNRRELKNFMGDLKLADIKQKRGAAL